MAQETYPVDPNDDDSFAPEELSPLRSMWAKLKRGALRPAQPASSAPTWRSGRAPLGAQSADDPASISPPLTFRPQAPARPSGTMGGRSPQPGAFNPGSALPGPGPRVVSEAIE